MGPIVVHTFDIVETIAQKREGRVQGRDIEYAKNFLDIGYDDSMPQGENASKSIFIKSKKGVDMSRFSQSDKTVLNKIWSTFGFLVGDRDALWQETHKYPEGNKFEDMGSSQQSIDSTELISTTKEGKDFLGAMSKDDIREVKSIYQERRLDWGEGV